MLIFGKNNILNITLIKIGKNVHKLHKSSRIYKKRSINFEKMHLKNIREFGKSPRILKWFMNLENYSQISKKIVDLTKFHKLEKVHGLKKVHKLEKFISLKNIHTFLKVCELKKPKH